MRGMVEFLAMVGGAPAFDSCEVSVDPFAPGTNASPVTSDKQAEKKETLRTNMQIRSVSVCCWRLGLERTAPTTTRLDSSTVRSDSRQLESR